MVQIEVPAPEPNWQPAPSYQGGNPNPAFQQSMWEFAAASFHLVAGLRPPLEALAARLLLTIERGWEDLGYVDVAMFRIRRVDFALSRMEGATVQDTFVWVRRSEDDVDAALDILLGALGIGHEALTFRGDTETGFYDPAEFAERQRIGNRRDTEPGESSQESTNGERTSPRRGRWRGLAHRIRGAVRSTGGRAG